MKSVSSAPASELPSDPLARILDLRREAGDVLWFRRKGNRPHPGQRRRFAPAEK